MTPKEKAIKDYCKRNGITRTNIKPSGDLIRAIDIAIEETKKEAKINYDDFQEIIKQLQKENQELRQQKLSYERKYDDLFRKQLKEKGLLFNQNQKEENK